MNILRTREQRIIAAFVAVAVVFEFFSGGLLHLLELLAVFVGMAAVAALIALWISRGEDE